MTRESDSETIESSTDNTSAGSGIVKTTTFEVREESEDPVESTEPPSNSLLTTAEWGEKLEARLEEQPPELQKLMIEQGRLAKARRRVLRVYDIT
jgi:hypothetical protein